MIRALVALALLASPALAGPPPGWQGGFSRPSILCDTLDQVRGIVEGLRESAAEGRARYVRLAGVRNPAGEPTCAITAVRRVTVGAAVDLGELPIGAAIMHAWSLPVSNHAGSGHYLYLEAVTPFPARAGAI